MDNCALRLDHFVVLLAEDDAVIRLCLSDLLETMGHTVLPAESTVEALALVEAEMKPDFALLDIMLAQHSDGITLANTLRERWHIPTIFVSGNLQGDTLYEAIRTGPLCIIRKPFSVVDLDRALELARTALRTDLSLYSDVIDYRRTDR